MFSTFIVITFLFSCPDYDKAGLVEHSYKIPVLALFAHMHCLLLDVISSYFLQIGNYLVRETVPL